MKKHLFLPLVFISICVFGQNKDFYTQHFFESSIEKTIATPNEIIYWGQPIIDGESNRNVKGCFVGVLDSNFKVKKRFDAGLQQARGSKVVFFEQIDKNLLLIGTHSWTCDVLGLRSKIGTFNTLSGVYTPLWNGNNNFLRDVCYVKSGQAIALNANKLHSFTIYDIKNWKESTLQVGLPSTEKINAIFGGNKRFYIFTNAKKWYSRSPFNDDLIYLGKTNNIENLVSNESFQVIEEDKKVIFSNRNKLHYVDFQQDSVQTRSLANMYASFDNIRYNENQARIYASSAGKIEEFDKQLQLLETHLLQSQTGSIANDFFLQNNQLFYAGAVVHRPNPMPNALGAAGGTFAAILPLQMPLKSADANLQNIDFQYSTPIIGVSTSPGPKTYGIDFGKAKATLKNTGTDTIRSVIFNLGHNTEPPAFSNCFPPIAKIWRFDSLAIAPNEQRDFELPKTALYDQGFTTKESMCIWVSLVNNAPDKDSKNNAFCKEFATIVATKEATSTLEDIRISPNPATDFISIESSELFSPKIVIYHILGKVLLSQNADNQNVTTLNIAFLPKGIYYIGIENKGDKVTKKLVKN